jgi:hypothetical protein
MVSNTGNAPFDFAVSEAAPWASVNPDSGSLAPGESMVLNVVFDSDSLPNGTYSDELTFSGTFDNVAGQVELTMHIGSTLYLPFITKPGAQ